MQEFATWTEPDPRRWWALGLLCGAFFMVILDAAIVTVALPSMEEELGFSAQGLQWVVSGYALTFAGLLLLGGRGRSARAPPGVHGGCCAVHPRVAAVRACLVRRGAGRGPRVPGGRRRGDDTDRALDHTDHIR